MNIESGRARINAGTERLDRTVEEMRKQHRSDVPQGELDGVVQNQTHPGFELLIEFVPSEPERQCEHQHEEDYVSREVPPPCR